MTATAKVFKNGRSQAVRLPREFRFDGDRVRVPSNSSARVGREAPDLIEFKSRVTDRVASAAIR